MESVKAKISKEHFKVEISTSTGNSILSDEPSNAGGQDAGLSPKELLAAALSSCTLITLRMYADRKGWPVDEIQVETSVDRNNEANLTTIVRRIEVFGNLSEEQRDRMLAIANACPVHKILTNPIQIQTDIY
jgi:putative redox protein